ncbi:hypothetical protein TNCV_4808921 [Trichonephila clavipes]|nr:hypothetical protein TNCV_4808921 [Trichonephila clavipes]
MSPVNSLDFLFSSSTLTESLLISCTLCLLSSSKRLGFFPFTFLLKVAASVIGHERQYLVTQSKDVSTRGLQLITRDLSNLFVTKSENEIWNETPDAGWEIVSPDDPDKGNGTKLLNYCIVLYPGQLRVASSNEYATNFATMHITARPDRGRKPVSEVIADVAPVIVNGL